MIPSNRLIFYTLIGLLISVIYAIIPIVAKLYGFPDQEIYQQKTILLWSVFMVILFLIAILDLSIGFKSRQVKIKRSLPNNLSNGAWIKVNLEISHKFKKPAIIQIFDHFPHTANVKQLPLNVELIPGKLSKISYRLQPVQRGDIEFGRIQYRCQSPLSLWHLNKFSGTSSSVKVYPDFAEIKKYILLGLDDRTGQLGIKLQQRRGVGLEFHGLRKYRIEDSMRQVDWKATSKKRELISREYQDERDQQILFMLDCGRRMRAKDENLSHFDHALNSMLLLSYVALHQGDAVGLMSFSGTKNVWLNPKKGSGRINTILNTVYNLQVCPNESDYSSAAKVFFNRHKKRSLVILISNSRDENIEELSAALSLLKKRHLVLFANLREEILDQIMEKPITNFDQAISYM